MPSVSHEGLVELFRRSPEVVADLLRECAVELPPFSVVRTDTATLTTLVPPEYRSEVAGLPHRGQVAVPLPSRGPSSSVSRWAAKPVELGPGNVDQHAGSLVARMVPASLGLQ